MMFRIVREPIADSLLDPDVQAGGIVIFEGRVRSTNDGHQVQALEYEAYDEMAVLQGEKILAEARLRFPIVEAVCVHRVGLLQLGDVAIRVEVASGHRREAFEACEFIVDEAKRRVPIWKKEHYADGVTEWLHADGRRAVTEEAFFDRQQRLDEVGPAGQEKLKAARVLLVGAGAIGSAAATYLAGAGIGHLTIVEPETVDVAHPHRQPLYGWSDVGRPKGRLAAERVRKLNPFVEVRVVDGFFSLSNAADLVGGHDLVIGAIDNFASSFLLNDACIEAGKPLITASARGWEGQMMVVSPGGPCYRCLWPDTPVDEPGSDDEGSAGVTAGVMGTLQAGEAIKMILGMPTTAGELVRVDLRDPNIQRSRVTKNDRCPTCGDEAMKESDIEVFPGTPLDDYLIVDIREQEEVEEEPLPFEGVLWMPMSAFDLSSPELAAAKKVLLVCHAGVRSAYLADQLRRHGDDRYYTLVGGLLGLS